MMTANVLAAAAALALFAAVLGAVLTAVFRWGSARHRDRLTHLTRVELAELFLFVDAGVFIRMNLVAVIILPLLVFLVAGIVPAAVTALLVLIAPTLIYRWLKSRRRLALQTQLPDVADALASALRAGLSLGQALEQVVKFQPRPSSQEVSLMLREHRLGLPLDRALQGLATRAASRDFHLLVTTLGIVRELGSGLAEALERFASMVRRRIALEERIRALTAQGRMQGWIMGALPILLAIVLTMMEPEAMAMLFSTPAGGAVCAAVLVLEMVGFLLIRRIVNIEV